MDIDEADHHFARRSSAAWAKYADAFFRISLARVSSRFSCKAECETVAWRPNGAAVDRSAVLEAVKGFRRLKGHKDMPKLVAALRVRDQQLGIVVSVQNVA
jgi:hypothetical protein